MGVVGGGIGILKTPESKPILGTGLAVFGLLLILGVSGLILTLVSVHVRERVEQNWKDRYPVLAGKRYDVQPPQEDLVYQVVFVQHLGEGEAVSLSLWQKSQQYWLLMTIPQMHRDFEAMSKAVPGTIIQIRLPVETGYTENVSDPAMKVRFDEVSSAGEKCSGAFTGR